MSERDLDSLELAAFRFVAGDMSPDEAAAFESQLAGNQQTCEAVCRAVAIAEKLTIVGPTANRRNHDATAAVSLNSTIFARVASPLGWMAIGAIAASFVFMLVRMPTVTPAGHGIERPVANVANLKSPAPDPLDADLVDMLAWTEMREATRWNVDFEWPDPPKLTARPFPILDSPTTIPDWILQTDGENE